MNKGIISVVSILTGAVAGAGTVGKIQGDKLNKANFLAKKHLALFLMMNQWVKVKQEGRKLSSFFEKNGYRRIAIYGMSYAGETLIRELRDTDVEVVYGIDQKADSIYADIDIVSLEGTLEEVDAVVVTAITFFDEIEEKISGKINCPVISLEDILYEI